MWVYLSSSASFLSQGRMRASYLGVLSYLRVSWGELLLCFLIYNYEAGGLSNPVLGDGSVVLGFKQGPFQTSGA